MSSCPAAVQLLHVDVRTLPLFPRQVRDAVVDQASQALQKLHPRIAEMAARGVRPAALQHWQRGGAEEAAGGPHGFGSGGLSRLFHFSSPSSPRSESCSLAWLESARAPPWWWAARCAAAACRSRLPARPLS